MGLSIIYDPRSTCWVDVNSPVDPNIWNLQTTLLEMTNVSNLPKTLDKVEGLENENLKKVIIWGRLQRSSLLLAS